MMQRKETQFVCAQKHVHHLAVERMQPGRSARRETSGGSLNRCDAPHGDAYLQRLRWYAGQTRWDSAIWRQDGQVAVYRGKVQAIQYRLLEG